MFISVFQGILWNFTVFYCFLGYFRFFVGHFRELKEFLCILVFFSVFYCLLGYVRVFQCILWFLSEF